jgi:hypothetical protein
MKKIMMILFAALMVVAFALPASAFENIFGGYFRVRAWHQENFNGVQVNGKDGNASLVDQRTRIYYTAKFTDNFKLVNKFEFDSAWGDTDGGDIGADAKDVEVKNTYVDFTLDTFNFKLGIQGWRLARGFMFDDDFAGAIVTYSGEAVTLPVTWVKAFEGLDDNGRAVDSNAKDVDYYTLAPTFTMGNFALNPYVMYIQSNNLRSWVENGGAFIPGLADGKLGVTADQLDDADIYYLGLDLDANFDAFSLWFTGIYQGGTIDIRGAQDIDIAAYLLAIGASTDLGAFGIHGQAFYAAGDDDNDDSDLETFFMPRGQSYYWSEIMGLGTFDVANGGYGTNSSAGSPGDQINNIWAANLGASMTPMDKLTATLDVWYAERVERDLILQKDTELGLEVDLKLTYALMDNLNLDVIGAYLLAGNGTTARIDEENDKDPYEIGTRLSLAF